jgi:hypothetical protein
MGFLLLPNSCIILRSHPLRQYDQALQYAKEALSLVRELGDKFKKVALSIMIVPPWRSANDKLAMQVAIGEILGIKT